MEPNNHHQPLQDSPIEAGDPLGPLMLLLVAAVALWVLPQSVLPMWVQPSVVGLLWGLQFLIGFWLGGVRRSAALSLGIAAGGAGLLTLAFRALTDFRLAECLLVSSLLLLSGWLTVRLDGRARRHWPGRRLRSQQWSLVDLFLATTLVACLIHGLRGMSSSPLLWVGVAGTLLIGACGSWAAYRWAWDDERPGLAALLVTLVLAAGGVTTAIRFSPSLTAEELIHWLVVGPLSVLAAQLCTVLLVLAVTRQYQPSLPEPS